MPLIIYLMLKSKIPYAILGLLLSFVTMAADNSIINDGQTTNLSGGTYTARVTASKAVVYSDENMLSPLGYIANGKAIVVGNPRRMNRDLVPIVVYGRIGYIEIKDIRYEDTSAEDYNVKRGAPREHNIDAIIQRPEEALSENNSFYFSLHTYAAGSEIKNAFLVIDNADESNFTGFQAQFIHRKEMSRVFWGAAIDYSSISSLNMKLAYWMISPTLGYTPIKNKLFLIDLYASLDLAVNTEFEITTNFQSEPTGLVYGVQLDSRIVFFPDAKYHLTGGVGLRKYKVSGLQTLKDLNDIPFEGITGISSLQLFLGVAMEFD